MSERFNPALSALLAAALFGATTPFARLLPGFVSPFTVAGPFYVGSGVGLAVCLALKRAVRKAWPVRDPHAGRIAAAEVPWLAGAPIDDAPSPCSLSGELRAPAGKRKTSRTI
jgi:hypothetical protein